MAASEVQRAEGGGMAAREVQRGEGHADRQPWPSGNHAGAALLTMDDFRGYIQIGKGKDSVVYACTCDKLGGRAVVLKVYDKTKVSAVKHRSIRREARIMKYLTYKGVPHVTEFIGAFQDKQQMYIVMEHASAGDLLEQLLKEGRAMSERRVAKEVCLPILASLVHLHALGIIHRDIKLENIFIDADRAIQLGDFGLALCVHEERAISPVGTLEYMPPEILKLPATDLIISGAVKPEDVVPVTEKVDIWSFGVTVYELVTGRSPYDGSSKEEVRANILANRIRALPSFLSAECMDFVYKALTVDAASRPSAVQLLQHPWMLCHCHMDDIQAVLASSDAIAGGSNTNHSEPADSNVSTVTIAAAGAADAAAKQHPMLASAAKAAANTSSSSPRSDAIPAYIPAGSADNSPLTSHQPAHSSTASSKPLAGPAAAVVSGSHSSGSTGSAVSMADSASSLHGPNQQFAPLHARLHKQQEPIMESPAEHQPTTSKAGKGGRGSKGIMGTAGAKKLSKWMCIFAAPSDGERSG